MQWLKRIIFALTGTGIALAAPVVPYDEKAVVWYEPYPGAETCYQRFADGSEAEFPCEEYWRIANTPGHPQPTETEYRSVISSRVADAAISFDASSGSSNTASASSVSWSHTAAAGSVLFVGYMTEDDCAGADATSVTYNGDPLTQVANHNPANTQCVEVWYDTAPESGTYTVTINIEASVSDPNGIAQSYAGVSTSDPAGATNTCNADNATACDISLTTESDNSWIVSFVNASDSATTDISIDAPATLRRTFDPGVSVFGGADRTTTSAASYSIGWNNSSDNIAAVAVEMKQEAVASIPRRIIITQ